MMYSMGRVTKRIIHTDTGPAWARAGMVFRRRSRFRLMAWRSVVSLMRVLMFPPPYAWAFLMATDLSGSQKIWTASPSRKRSSCSKRESLTSVPSERSRAVLTTVPM